MDLLKRSVENHKWGEKEEGSREEESKYMLTRQSHFIKNLLYATVYTYFQSKKLTSAKITLILVIKEMGYTNEHWHATNRVALALEPISNSQNGDWERGYCPHYLHMKAPQNNQAKILLFECHQYIKVCVLCNYLEPF